MGLEDLLAALLRLLPQLQAQAEISDREAGFPHAAFAALTEIGLLTATLPVAMGGDGFGAGIEGAAGLDRLLYKLGEADLPLARIFEAHVNALQLILRYGTPDQAATAAADAGAGHLFALWVTDPPGGGTVLDDGLMLHGGKLFCSAAGVATRALITAGTTAGTQMLVVALAPGTRVLPGRIKLSGMRAAITGGVDFTGMQLGPEAVLGQPGDYLREPVFSAGAWRGAAAALGGLGALLRLLRDELQARGRDADPHQRARFGQVVIAHETARLWNGQAALRACLEDQPAAAIVAYVNLARLAVEAACLDGLRHVQRALGLTGFIAGHPAERVARDLATYLRQPAPDETLDKAAGHYLRGALPGS